MTGAFNDVRPGDGAPLLRLTGRLLTPERGERAFSLHLAGLRTDWEVRRWDWKAGKLSDALLQDITNTVANRLYDALVALEGVQEALPGSFRS